MVTVTISDKEYELCKSKGAGYLESLKAKSCHTCRTIFSYEGLEERRAERKIAYNCPNCKGIGKLVPYNKSKGAII